MLVRRKRRRRVARRQYVPRHPVVRKRHRGVRRAVVRLVHASRRDRDRPLIYMNRCHVLRIAVILVDDSGVNDVIACVEVGESLRGACATIGGIGHAGEVVRGGIGIVEACGGVRA